MEKKTPKKWADFTPQEKKDAVIGLLGFAFLAICIIFVVKFCTAPDSTANKPAKEISPTALPSASDLEESDRKQREHNQQLFNQMQVVTADDVSKAYEENPLRAERRFKNISFRIKGQMEEVGRIQGEPMVMLKTRSGEGVVVQYLNGFEFQLEDYKKGDLIELVCVGSMLQPGTPIAYNCRMPTPAETETP